MEVKYLGHSSFSFKGKLATVVTDPFSSEKVGLKFPSTEADIVTISHDHPDHNETKNITGDPLILDLPGEYEKKAVRVTGFPSYHDKHEGAERGKNTLFKIEIDDISILHCGDLGHTLTDELLEEIGTVHVLCIPVGGHYTIDATDAVQVIKHVEPLLVIPMHYKMPGMTPMFDEITPVDDFLVKMGLTAEEKPKKLVLKLEELGEDMKTVVMDTV